jgi:hypothetical protein
VFHRVFLPHYNSQQEIKPIISMVGSVRSISMAYKFESEVFDELLDLYFAECFEKEISSVGFSNIMQSSDETINPLRWSLVRMLPGLETDIKNYFRAMIDASSNNEKEAIIAQYKTVPHNFNIARNGRIVGCLERSDVFHGERIINSWLTFPMISYYGPNGEGFNARFNQRQQLYASDVLNYRLHMRLT